MPAARKVVTRSPKRTVGLINCRWFQNQPIEHESRLEKHFVYRALLCPGLSKIQHQPFRLELQRSGKYYTPDFLLFFSDGSHIVVEVKRSEKVKPLKDRFCEISERLAERNLPFFVLHQGQIEGDLRASRAALIRRYAMLSMSPETVEHAVAFVALHPQGVSIGKLTAALKLSEPQLYRLLARRDIAVGARLALSDSDLVFPIPKDTSHASHQFGSWFGAAPWNPYARVRPDTGG